MKHQKNLLLGAGMCLLLLSASPAIHAAETADTQLKAAVQKVEKATQKALEKVAEAIDEAVRTEPVDTVRVSDILGKPIYALNGSKLGNLKDMLVDQEGVAQTAIIASGGVLGFGQKLTSYPYPNVVALNANEKIALMPLAPEVKDAGQPFSYKTTDANDGMQVVPAGHFSVNELLRAPVINTRGKEVGHISSMVLSERKVEEVVVDYDTNLLESPTNTTHYSFHDMSLFRKDGKINIQVNQNLALMGF